MSEHDERVAVLEWAHQLVPGLDDTPLTGDEEYWFAEGALAGWEHARAESAAVIEAALRQRDTAILACSNESAAKDARVVESESALRRLLFASHCLGKAVDDVIEALQKGVPPLWEPLRQASAVMDAAEDQARAVLAGPGAQDQVGEEVSLNGSEDETP